MKFRVEDREYETTHTVDGVTVPVTRTRKVAVPVLPRDLDAIAERSVVALVLTLTLISITWSTVSIAHLLHGTWTAYLAGAVFDLAWLAALGMSYIVRFRPERRAVVDRVGWALLAVTVAAIVLEGLHIGGIAMAIIGASVSIAAKTLWWTWNRSTRPDLSAEDAQWVAARMSEASARLAVASVERKVARVEDLAATQRMALEASRRPPVGVELPGPAAEEKPVLTGDLSNQAQATAEPGKSHHHPVVTQEVVSPPPPPAPLPPVMPAAELEAAPPPLLAVVAKPKASGPEAVRAYIRERLEKGDVEEPDLTLEVAERFGISPRTAQLRKKDVKDAMAAEQAG